MIIGMVVDMIGMHVGVCRIRGGVLVGVGGSLSR